MRGLLKLLLPPVLILMYKKLFPSKYGWKGDFSSWNKAQKIAQGYDSQEILSKVSSSLLKVKNGKSVYERDSVLFDEIQYSWPLLAGLMYAAAKSGGHLSVLDFGGSLGSTYYQNKKFLSGLKKFSWSIVEQKKFVLEGNRKFANENLNFFEDIDDCLVEISPNVLLLSSVLQYIEDPYAILNELFSHDFDVVIVDRTPFVYGSSERITLQVVPPSIYEASYPCRMMDEKKFVNFFADKGFTVLEEFPALDGAYRDYCFKGFIMEKVTPGNVAS